MGCDGGTIPRRDELVRVKKKPEQKDKAAELAFRWQHCSITQEKLQSPIVACELGRLYNKDSVIEGLLDKASMPDSASHIRSLKDIKDLNLTENPTYEPDAADKGDAYIDRQASQYICPVVGLEMSGKFKFCFLWKCGCVASERALKTIKGNICHKCQQTFSEEDIVILNASDDDLELMTAKMEYRRAKAKAEKKFKKRPAEAVGQVPSCSSSKVPKIENGSVEETVNVPSTSKQMTVNVPSTSKLLTVNVPSTSKLLTVNGKHDKQQQPVKNGKLVGAHMNGVKPKLEDPVLKKTKSDYSVAKDPKASEVFKSLFTSHKNAQQQEKAHWITYNPFYN